MKVFQVRHATSRAIVWTGEASCPERALEAAAQAAGYHTFSELPDDVKADMTAEVLSL